MKCKCVGKKINMHHISPTTLTNKQILKHHHLIKTLSCAFIFTHEELDRRNVKFTPEYFVHTNEIRKMFHHDIYIGLELS